MNNPKCKEGFKGLYIESVEELEELKEDILNRMSKEGVLKDLLSIFESNTDETGLTSVHGVYNSLKEYMVKLESEIQSEKSI
jgi:hypothetical protein